MDPEALYKALKTQKWIVLFILSSLSYLLMKPPFTLGIICGGLIVIANFGVLKYIITSAFSTEGVMTRSKPSIIVKYYLKLILTAVLIFIILRYSLVDPVGLTIGLSVVVISIINLAVRAAWKTSSGEAI